MDSIRDLVTEYFDEVLIALVVLPLAFFISSVLRRYLRALMKPILPGSAAFVAMLAQVFVFLIALTIVVYTAGASVALILTVVAIVSAGVSLALDRSVQDAIAGLKILFFGYVKVGDHVKIDGYDGEVVATDLFMMTMKTRTRDAILIPNSEVFRKIVINRSMIKGQAIDSSVPILRPYDRHVVEEILTATAQDVNDK